MTGTFTSTAGAVFYVGTCGTCGMRYAAVDEHDAEAGACLQHRETSQGGQT